MTVGSLCFIFYNQSLGKRWVMVVVGYYSNSKAFVKHKPRERIRQNGESWVPTKRFNPSLLVLKAVLSGPPPAVYLPQTKLRDILVACQL